MNVEDIKKFYFFQKLSSGQLDLITKVAKDRILPVGTAVFKEDDKSTALYLVELGSIKLSRTQRRSGTETAVIGSGGHFGELAFFHRKPRTAEALALESTKLWEITYAALDELIVADPALGQAFYKNAATFVTERLRELPEDVSDINTLKLRSQ